jgi:hypothetical protein
MTGPHWTDADFAAIEQLNAPQTVYIFGPHRPPVVVNAQGYETIAYCDSTNPLAAEAVRAFYEHTRQALAADDGALERGELFAERAAQARDLQDRILAGILVSPPYCPKSRFQDGRPLPGHLHYASFTPEQRRQLADLFYRGADALKPFRPEPGADEPVAGDGGGLRDAAAPLPAGDGAVAAVSPVVAERSGDGVGEPATPVGVRAGTDPALSGTFTLGAAGIPGPA